MENYEELLNRLEEFERTKPKEIPKELEDFIGIVAKTGDPIYPWPKIKLVYRSKIVNVLAQFFEAGPSTDTSQFSFESMRSKILERFDLFRSAPFTIQRLSELLINPRKEYNRIDKFMRAIEKNILVVSVAEPGCSKHVHLNGSVEIMEEGFQMSSTSVYEEYRQRVAGITENEVAAATISEDGQTDVRKAEGRSKKSEEDLRVEERDHKRTGSRSSAPTDSDTTNQGRETENQGPMLDHQEFHRLEFSLAETDTLAIVEIVSEVDCPPDGAEVSEDSNKEYPLGNSMIAEDSSEGNETAVDAVISEVDNCDSVTEVVATDTVGSDSVDEDLVTSDKVNESAKPIEKNLCLDASPSKDASPLDNIDADAKVDSQNIDVVDIGSSVDVHQKGESDSGLSTSTKVLVISSPGESEFQDNINCNPICDLEVTEKSKDELNYIGADKNQSASEKPSDEDDGDTSQPTASLSLKNAQDSKDEHKISPEHASPAAKSPSSDGDESSSYNEEAMSSVKADAS